MRKIAIITAIVLTTGLTAFSLSRKNNTTAVTLKVTPAKMAATNVLATAD